MKQQIILGDSIYLLSPAERDIKKLTLLLRQLNPLREAAKRSGRYYRNIPQYIDQVVFDLENSTYQIPIGYIQEVKEYYENVPGMDLDIIDQRIEGRDFEDMEYEGWNQNYKLRPHQKAAAERAMAEKSGQIIIPARGGKTVTACAIIDKTKKKTLWLTHRKPLFVQTHRELEKVLCRNVYRIGAGLNHFTENGDIFIAMVATLRNRPDILHWMRRNIGLVIIDECHHVPSATFTDVLKGFQCDKKIGLTATPIRKDGMEFLLKAMFGDVVYEIDIEHLKEQGILMQPEVIPVYTEFTGYDNTNLGTLEITYNELLDRLTNDFNRNQLIAHTVASTVKNGMVISRRVEHCKFINELLLAKGVKSEVITGSIKDDERQAIINRFAKGELECIVASMQLVQEGLDLPILEQLYFATPNAGDKYGKKSGSSIQQALSRVMTEDKNNPNKEPKIWYFVDYENDLIKSQWMTVRTVFKRMGIPVPRKPAKSYEDVYADIYEMLEG